MNQDFYFTSFDTASQCMQAERLASGKFHTLVIPTPREVTANCGLSLRFRETDRAKLCDFCHSLPFSCLLYHMSPEGVEKVIS